MSRNKLVKPVSFNITKDLDIKLISHVKGKNFSGYVKELIHEDMLKREEKLKIVHKSEKGGIKIVLG